MTDQAICLLFLFWASHGDVGTHLHHHIMHTVTLVSLSSFLSSQSEDCFRVAASRLLVFLVNANSDDNGAQLHYHTMYISFSFQVPSSLNQKVIQGMLLLILLLLLVIHMLARVLQASWETYKGTKTCMGRQQRAAMYY